MANISKANTDKDKKIKSQLLAGQMTKYDEEKHITLLYDVFSQGDDVAAFCAEAVISKPTFYKWLKAHEKFEHTYEVVKCKAAAYWERLPMTQEGRDINYHYWFMIMKNRFGYGKTRFEVSKEQTALDIIHAIFDALRNSELSIQEAVQLANIANTKANIEAGKTSDNVYVPQPTEQIQERADALQKLIERNQKVIDQEEKLKQIAA